VHVDGEVVDDHPVNVRAVEAERRMVDEEEQKPAVVAFAHACVEPRAVVVEARDALVADDAMFGARGPRQHARAAHLGRVQRAVVGHSREAVQAGRGDGAGVGE